MAVALSTIIGTSFTNYIYNNGWALIKGAFKKEVPTLPEHCLSISFEYGGKVFAGILKRGDPWTYDTLEKSLKEFASQSIQAAAVRFTIKIVSDIVGKATHQLAPGIYQRSPSASVLVSAGCIARGLVAPPEGMGRLAAAYNEAVDLGVIFVADVAQEAGKRIGPMTGYACRLAASVVGEFIALGIKAQPSA